MSSRTSSTIALALLLAGCGGSGAGDPGAQTTPSASGGPDTMIAGDHVSCALGGSATFTETCTLERARIEGEPVLVIRHADGGFRRLALLPEGGLAEADGADRAEIVRDGDTLEVRIAQDRYRLASTQVADVR